MRFNTTAWRLTHVRARVRLTHCPAHPHSARVAHQVLPVGGFACAALWCAVLRLALQFGKAAAMGGAGWVLYKIVKSIPPIPVSDRSVI